MKKHILPAIKLSLVCLVLFILIYPGMLWALSQFAPGRGEGKTLETDSHVYYEQVGQAFSSDAYFWSRPSQVNYNAAGSGASNLASSNPAYLKTVEERLNHFLERNPAVSRDQVPIDLITASGSGLDPHISLATARVQIPRLAAARGISINALEKLVDEQKESALWGLFGPVKVHVLKLNIALDKLTEKRGGNDHE